MPTLRTRLRSFGLITVGAGFAALPFTAQAAGDVSSEISMAQKHAILSAQGNTLAMAQLHLHHVLNCLEGPTGKWFDPNQVNPCKGMGDGAIPDATSHQQRVMLEHLAARAHAALMSKRLATVHHYATTIAADLKKMG